MPETLAAAASSAVPSPTTASSPRPRRWGRGLLAVAGLLALRAAVGLQLLDPWLRQTLEQQVARQTHGQYHLRVGALHTSLWQRAIRLRQLRLRPAAQVADTLPRVRLDVARLNVTGVGLWALLRRGLVPVDSVVLDSARVEVLALPRRPAKGASRPLHEGLPLHLQGLAIGYFGLLNTRAEYLPPAQPTTGQLQRADLTGRDVLISPAGAADTHRLGYAAAWNLRLLHLQGQAQGHRLTLARLQVATAAHRLQLDSVRVLPIEPTRTGPARVDLALRRLRLTGRDAAARQHRHQLRADSLVLLSPPQALTPPAGPQKSPIEHSHFSRLDLAHLAVRNGYLHLSGTGPAATAQGIAVTATAIHVDSTAAPAAQDVLFARAWTVALGPSRATVAAHALTLASLRLSTAAGTLDLRAVRIRPPAPGQGKPGGVRVDLALPGLTLAGLDARALQHEHRLQARSLVLAGPRLNFTPPTQSPPPVWKLLSKFLRRTDLAQLRIEHADVRVGRWRHSPDVHDLNVTGRALRIDSLAAAEPRRIAYARAWQAHAGRLSAPFDPPYYRASSAHTRLDTDAHTLRFDNLLLQPKYSAVGMNLHKGYQAPATTIKLAALTATGLDFAGLVRHGNFRIARATAQRPTVYIASDGRGPINPNQSKISPEEMIHLPVIVDVRRFDIKNGNLYSSYRSPLTPITGTMSINRFNGYFLNLSNDPRRQTPATPLTGKASTYLQNQCRLEAQVSMFLLDPRGRHRVWGTFGPGPFAMLNSMTVPTRLVEFKKGDVQRLRFDMQADRQGVTGTMWAEYSGLQLELLGYKHEEIKKTLLKSVVSKVANVLVIRDQNPRKRGELVSGQMTSTREPRFSVFTLWRQGMVSGLFNNVGVPQQLAQKLSETKDQAPLPK
ncbi:MAG: hypothetical protein NVS3B25_13490 [Hymenobacter sp.]